MSGATEGRRRVCRDGRDAPAASRAPGYPKEGRVTSFPVRSAIAAMMTAGALLLAGSGGAAVVPPPATPTDVQIRASGASPLTTGCAGPGIGGTLYAGSEVEPYIAINPQDTTNVIGVWQQDRWSSGGAQGLL